MAPWCSVLELDDKLRVSAGSEQALQAAVGRGADLRIYTAFLHNEHLEPGSDNREIVQEVSDFRVTYLVDRRWVAGIMNLRVPINPPQGFGPRPSMSFFMYNQNGRQAIARPYLDGRPAEEPSGRSAPGDHSDMPKYHEHDAWDADSNAPSSNFTYDFEAFRFFVRDDWREVLAHAADGAVLSGSLDELVQAFAAGCEIKVALRGLCADLGGDLDHEVFVHSGPGYYSTESRIFCAGTQPVVRVRPGIPMVYSSRAWDFGWLMPRTDGFVARWLCDPYTLGFAKSEGRYALRWFTR